MKKEGKILLIAVILIFISLFILNSFQEPPEPKEFVKNKTVANYSNLFFKYETLRYPSNVEIMPLENFNGTILGFVTDTWNLNFGIIPGNGSFVKRNIELSNLEERNIKIILKAYGNISPLVVFSKNDFILKPDEKVTIDVFLYSKDFKNGNYTGEIDLIAKKSIYNFLPIS